MKVENEENCTFLKKVNELQKLEKSVSEIPKQRQAERKAFSIIPREIYIGFKTAC